MTNKYSREKLEKIWKHHTKQNIDKKLWKDKKYGRQIHWDQYGTRTPQGWDIHHIDGNRDNNEIENLRPIHWKSHMELHNNK